MGKRSKHCKHRVLGLADHTAVLAVGGRAGARLGPQAFERVYKTFKGAAVFWRAPGVEPMLTWFPPTEGALHSQAGAWIAQNHPAGGVSVVVGGSHDHGYSQLLGLSQHCRKLACINIDAHLDVRTNVPVMTSGSPFFAALESKLLRPEAFTEFGIQSHCNAPELWEYVRAKKVRVVPFGELRGGVAVRRFKSELKRLRARCDGLVLSLDLDAASAAFAPGVSAPQAEGFTASELIEMVETAGKDPKVVSLGLFELNPEHDVDGRTARLAATLAYHFLEAALG